MILPIRIYGDPILRRQTQDVEADSKGLQELIADMHETLQQAAGIGLAAPQVGRTERLFLVDLSELLESADPSQAALLPPQPMAFINPRLLWEGAEEEDFEEGCLSIPEVREMVTRPERIRLAYRDRSFQPQELETGGLLARVIQHEYDHLEGVLFIDLLSPFRRGLLKRRLREMAQGNVEAPYAIAAGGEAVG